MATRIDQYFFFSYAREDETNPAEDHAEFIYEFFVDLANTVKDLENKKTSGLLRDEDPVGFIDRNLAPGSDYVKSLPDALQRCKSVVCLYSSRYFTRMICGQEVQVFVDRMKEDNRNPEVILPVFWERPNDVVIPETLRTIQFNEQAFPYTYRQLGLRELMVKNMAMERRKLVVAMANWVLNANTFDLAPRAEPVDMSQQPRAFPQLPVPGTPGPAALPAEGPKAVRFVYVAGTRPAWAWAPFPAPQPPPPPPEPIGTLAAGIAVQKGFFPDVLDLPPGTVASSFIDELDRAKTNNTPVVLLIDPSTLQTTTYYNLIKEYDRVNFLNCAALVVWDAITSLTASQRQTLEGLVDTVFDDTIARTSQFFLDDIHSAGDLADKLPKVLENLQTNVRSKGAARRKVPGSNSALPAI